MNRARPPCRKERHRVESRMRQIVHHKGRIAVTGILKQQLLSRVSGTRVFSSSPPLQRHYKDNRERNEVKEMNETQNSPQALQTVLPAGSRLQSGLSDTPQLAHAVRPGDNTEDEDKPRSSWPSADRTRVSRSLQRREEGTERTHFAEVRR